MLVFSTSGIASSVRMARTASGRRTSRIGRDVKMALSSSTVPCAASRAGLDDRNPLAVLRLVQVMRRDEDGHATRGQILDEPPEPAPRERIDASGRLVEKHDRRLVEDRAPEGQSLPPAAGQGPRQLAFTAAQAGHLEHEVAARGQPLARTARTPRRRRRCSDRR